MAKNKNKKLKVHVHVPDEDGVMVAFGPDDKVPGWARKAITNPDVWADDDEDEETASEPSDPSDSDGGDGGDGDGDGDETEEVDSYGDLKVDQLKAEVQARNEGREDDDLIVVGGKGNKADLVAALEADDAASE